MNPTEQPAHTSLLDAQILKNQTLRIKVLPQFGGKIASIRHEGHELLQQPLQPYAKRLKYMAFDESDASGWDECLPSVAACYVDGAAVPDHGDFWQLEWRVDVQTAESITFSAEAFSLPLKFTRTMTLHENSLKIAYKVQNTSQKSVPYIWSAHPLFAVEAGDRIVLPPSIHKVTVEGSAGDRLGKNGTVHPWPQTKLAGGSECDLSIAGEITDNTGDKLFAIAPFEGWCAIERRSLKKRVEMHFDAKESPYLGLWLCYGGWPEDKPNRQYCVALEPCSALGDSLAIAVKENRARILDPGAENQWTVEFRVTGVS